jgi:CRP-like cAMP-binding protein
LLGIPEKELSLLAPHLDHVALEDGVVLEREGARIDEVYFLNRGIALMVVETIEGKSVEVGLIGRGSMVGLQVAAGIEDFTHGVAMLTAGEAFRAKVGALPTVLSSTPELRRMLLRRLAVRSVELAQNAACKTRPSLAKNAGQQSTGWWCSNGTKYNLEAGNTGFSLVYVIITLSIGSDWLINQSGNLQWNRKVPRAGS